MSRKPNYSVALRNITTLLSAKQFAVQEFSSQPSFGYQGADDEFTHFLLSECLNYINESELKNAIKMAVKEMRDFRAAMLRIRTKKAAAAEIPHQFEACRYSEFQSVTCSKCGLIEAHLIHHQPEPIR